MKAIVNALALAADLTPGATLIAVGVALMVGGLTNTIWY